MKRKHILFVGAIITVIALFGFGKTDAKADQEMVTEWFSEPHPEYFIFADCVEETAGGENATHYVYERYLWHDGKTWRATSKRLVPSDYTLNKYITSRDYGGVGKNTKKYNLWLSKEYDYPVQEESGGGYNVVSVTGEEFHAWSFYTVSSGSAPTQYRYRFSRTHNEYITNLNGYYRITTVPGKSFDVAGWGTESGTNLIIWDDIPPQANQTFLFSLQSDGSYIISDQNSGLCIDVDGDTVDGTNICMKTYNGGTSQRWYIGANSDGTYTFTSALFKVYVADITWGADNENGSNVWLWLWHGGQNQRFWIEPLEKPPVDERELFVNRVIQENSSFGGKAVGELINKPQYMYGSWCARFIWNMAKEAGCEYAIPSGYDSAKNLPEAIKNNGGKLWSWKDVADGKYVPQAGDIIVYGESVYENGKNMNWAHVGVITECAYDQKTGKPSFFKTIEGNTSVGKDKKGNTLLGINSKTRKVKNTKTGYTTTNGKNKQGQTKYWFIRYIVEPNF